MIIFKKRTGINMLIRNFLSLTRYTINYIFAFQLFFTSILLGQHIYPHFEQITSEQGLSNNRVNNTIKDSRGFIWIATADGLNRYDGYKFKIYRYDPSDSTSLADNFVYSLREDRLGNIWVGTRSAGLNKLDRKNGRFRRIKLYPPGASQEEQQKFNSVYAIYNDPFAKDNVLWIFTSKSTSTKIIKVDNAIYHLRINGGNNCIVRDSTSLWIGGASGFRKFDKQTNSVTTSFKNIVQNEAELYITDMYQDFDGLLWLACWRDGLKTFDPNTEEITANIYNPDHMPGIGSNVVFDIKQDSAGRLWIVTAGDGYYQYDKIKKKFTCYRKPQIYTRLGLNFWNKLYIDDTDIHWISTKNDGILKFTPKKDKFTHYNLSSETETEVDIRAFYKDETDTLWVSAVGSLYKFDTQTGSYKKTKYDRNHNNKLYQHSISVFYEDRNGILWLGTEGGGLKRYDKSHNKVMEYYNTSSRKISNVAFEMDNYILSLREDLYGKFWIKTFGGYSHYLFDKKDLCYLSNPGFSYYNLCFRLETSIAGNGYVGPDAANDDELIDSVYKVLKENWPNPKGPNIDVI